MRRYITWISKNGIILSIVAILVLIGSSVVMMMININLLQKNNDFKSDLTEINNNFADMLDNIQTADLALRGYYIVPEDQLLIPMDDATEGHSRVFRELRVLLGKYNYDLNELKKLEVKFKDYIDLNKSLVEKIAVNDREPVADVLKADPGYFLWKDYVAYTEPILNDFDEQLAINKVSYDRVYLNSIILQIIIFLIGLPTVILMIRKIKRNEKSLNQLFQEIVDSNKTYVFDNRKDDQSNDQKSIIENLVNNLKKASNYINHISEGNYDVRWEGMTEDLREHNQKNLAGELIKMKYRMIEVKKEDEMRMWHTEGLAKFAEIVRSDVSDLKEMSDKIIGNLVNYVKANQGGLFLVNRDDESEPFIELMGCYAYDRKKFIEKRIESGQGLIGQTFKEGTTLHLTEIPADYVHITSGLGESTPSCLLIVPLIVNEVIVGLIELASFEDFQPHQIDFLEKVGEIIASSINGIRTNHKTKEILAISQSQAEEMKAQEEEMRQNMEEMEATQEEMARTQGELALKEANLQALVNNTTDLIITVDKDYQVSILNGVGKSIFKELHNVELEEGANILNLVGSDKDFWRKILDKAYNGERQTFTKQITIGGKQTWREYFVDGIKDTDNMINGASIFSRDITESVVAQKDLAFEKSLFTALMESSPDAIYFKDMKSKFLRVSNTMLDHFKLKKEADIIGKSDFDFFDKVHAQPAFDDEQKIIKTDTPVIGIIEKEVHNDGTESWVETSKMSLKNENGDIIGTFGVSKNVTEKMKAQLDLEQNRLIADSIINNSNNAYLVVDQSLKILLINDALKEFYGDKGDRIKTGDNFLDLVEKDARTQWKKRFEYLLKNENLEETEEIIIDQNNSQTHLIKGVLIKNEENEIFAYGIIFSQLSEAEKKNVAV